MWSLQPQQLCLSSEEELQLDAVHATASDYVCIQSTATCDMFILIFFYALRERAAAGGHWWFSQPTPQLRGGDRENRSGRGPPGGAGLNRM